jgi:hypothetical protein
MIASYKEKIKIKKYTETNIAEQLNASLFVILYRRSDSILGTIFTTYRGIIIRVQA